MSSAAPAHSQNQRQAVVVESNAADNTVVVLYADPTTHRLLVDTTVTPSGTQDVNLTKVGGTAIAIGQALMAASLPVVIASNQSAIPVTLTSTTVTGTVTVAGGKTNNNAAPGATNIGSLGGVATAAAPSYTEGNQVALSTDLAGALRVTGSLSVGGTTDNSAYTAGTSTGTPSMGFYHATVDTVTDGRAAAVAITSKRAQHTSLFDAAGNALLGQKAMAASVPVVLASDQASIPVAATLTAETTKVIGTVRMLGNVGAIVDGVITAGASPANGVMGLGVYNSTEPSPTTGQSVGIQLDSKGRQRMVIMDAATNTRGVNVDANNNMGVVLAAETTKVIGTINIAASQTVGLVAGSAIVGKVGIDQTTPGTTNAVALAQIGSTTTATGNGVVGAGVQRQSVASDNSAVALWGHGATAASVPANTVYQGKRAATALPTAVTDGQNVGAMADKFGRAVTLVNAIRDLVGTQTTTISASTSETTIVTAIASTFNDLIMLVVSNTSTSTSTRIDFRDTTAGSVLFSLTSIGGQPPVGFAPSSPIPQTTVNTNWTAQCATSTTDVRVYAVFAKNK